MGKTRLGVVVMMGLAALVGSIGLSTSVTACGGSSSDDVTSQSTTDSGTASDTSTSTEASEAPYTLDDICERTAPVICDIRKPCCTSSGIGYDEAGCVKHAKEACAKDVAEVRAGRATFHPERIPDCIPKYRAIFTEQCVLTFSLIQKYFRDIGACETFVGQKAEGVTCEKTNECKPGETKDIIAGCDDDTKKCKYSTLVAENGYCSIGDGLPYLCDDGLYCDVDFTKVDAGQAPGTCKKKTALAATCDSTKSPSLECGLGNYCDKTTNKCVAGRGGGETCSDNLECGAVSCVKVGAAPTGTCKALGNFAKSEECKGL